MVASNGSHPLKSASTSRARAQSRAQSRTSSKRQSSVFYKNDDKRCAQITSSRRERCKNHVNPGGNYCPYHEKLREKQILEHAKLLKMKGGKVVSPNKAIYDYNYYLDDEDVEPFDSNASLVSAHPLIWIGSIDSAHDLNFLKGNGIKSVMNASGMEPTPQARDMYNKLGIDYYTLSEIEKVPYKSHFRVSRYLGDEKFSKSGLTPREFFKFMHKGCQLMNQPSFKFPVLIHCHAGINRSGSLIAAYLMTKPRPYDYDKTVEMLKKANMRRNLDVLTNQDFKRALKYFPIFMGTPDKISPQTMARYKHFLNAYEKQ